MFIELFGVELDFDGAIVQFAHYPSIFFPVGPQYFHQTSNSWSPIHCNNIGGSRPAPKVVTEKQFRRTADAVSQGVLDYVLFSRF